MYRRPSPSRPNGFTLVELLVVIGIIALLMSILLPTLGKVREQGNRMKCASNLRQIAMSAIAYATENKGQFPRTYYQPGVGLLNSNKGGLGNAPSANSFSRTDPAGPVGASNVAASLYLLLKYKYVTTEIFRCPSAIAAETLEPSTVDDYSNFPTPMRKYNSYSYAALFPNNAAVNQGWKLNLSSGSEWPIAADLNPGKGGKNYTTDDVQDVTSVRFTDTPREQARANSNNHTNRGQGVAYVDGHVDWSPTVFCGPQKPGRAWRDNIFASTHTVDAATGLGGGVHTQPNERFDVVLHPGDGAN